MADTLYLEVDKSNGAILSYSDTKLESKTSDYIEATEAELNYLNAVEAKLPAGMVTTLADLQGYRANVKKLDVLKFQIAQDNGKIAQIKAKMGAIQAERSALLKAGAARHGVTVAEYEAEMIAQYKALQAGTDTPQVESGLTREERAASIRKMMSQRRGFVPTKLNIIDQP